MAGSSKSGNGKEWKGLIRAWKGSEWGNEALLDLRFCKACKTKLCLTGSLCANLLWPVLHAPTAILGNVEERNVAPKMGRTAKAMAAKSAAKKVKKEVRTTRKAKPKRVKEPVLETAGDASASDQAAKKEDGQAPMVMGLGPHQASWATPEAQ